MSAKLPDVVLLDVMMPGMDGLATLRSLKAAHPDVQVIMLSGRETPATIVEALSLGAINYVVKPNDPDGLGEIALEAAITGDGARQLVSEARPSSRRRVQATTRPRRSCSGARAKTMREHRGHRGSRADNDVTVLLRGESGVGKELVGARDSRSDRFGARSPFVKDQLRRAPGRSPSRASCSATKGRVHRCRRRRVIGKFEHADGGTLMLDEIGEMKAGLQGKLLHVLQDGDFSRLGSNKRLPQTCASWQRPTAIWKRCSSARSFART